MNPGYEEILNGESLLRSHPNSRHERICERLHQQVGLSMATLTSTRILPPRSIVRIAPGSLIRPDLALVASATGKLWLTAEIINAQDHRTDTVVKKSIYDEIRLPRLWMIDPRYDNVEVYHGSPYGPVLKRMLAHFELLDEPLLPGFGITAKQLFEP